MGELRFSFGTMGSGKSTLALQIHHNLDGCGLVGRLYTRLDREGARVSSALGVSAEAVVVEPDVDFMAEARSIIAESGRLHYLVCDEAQFYDPVQVDQLAAVVDEFGADVHAFGLLRDFRGRLFPGTTRLLELADRATEVEVEARCWCGRRATHNARLVDGHQVIAGEVEVVDDPERSPEVTYELRCRRHWIAGAGPAALETAVGTSDV